MIMSELLCNVIDAREKFRSEGIEYKVSIKVAVNWRFIKAVARCVLLRKHLIIHHTYTSDPFIVANNGT